LSAARAASIDIRPPPKRTSGGMAAIWAAMSAEEARSSMWAAKAAGVAPVRASEETSPVDMPRLRAYSRMF